MGQSAVGNRQFYPVSAGSIGTSKRLDILPWEVILPHERQAYRNHGQTLKRLAERGGLSACEALAILEDRPWEKMELEASIKAIELIVARQMAST